MSVLKSLLPNEIDFNFKYIDTISICKHFVSGKKNLSACAQFFNIDIANHHNSCDDAIACAKIAIACIKLSGYKTLPEFCFYVSDIPVHSFSELVVHEEGFFKENQQKTKHFKWKSSKIKPSDITRTVDFIDKSNPLYGKNIVFTGELEMSRSEAMQIAVNKGAIVKTSVSKKVQYLVIGQQDKSIVGENGLSSKEEKAIAINSIGDVHIEMITEQQFLSLANGEVFV